MKIKLKTGFFVIVLCFSHVWASEVVSFNKDWKFTRLPVGPDEKILEVAPGFAMTDFNDSVWESVSLPHTARIEPQIVNDMWQGICWYRKKFNVPVEANNKKTIIEFEAAMNHSAVWINGQLVTDHQGGYLPVVIDATKFVMSGQGNLIAVQLDNTDNVITGPKPLEILDFCMYGGLYRNARLILKDKVHISHPIVANKVAGGGIFITYPKVSKEESVVKVKTHVVNEYNEPKSAEVIQSVIYDGEQIAEQKSSVLLGAGEDAEVTNQIQLKNAKLWSPDSPILYQLETTVLVDGKTVDQESTRFGIRQFVFKGKDLYINGQKTFLRGVNRHQEYPFIGYALSDNAQYRDAKKIKDAGFNYIRLSHYPHSPAFMDACDELGLITLDAILGWQFYNDDDRFRTYCYRSATDLIRRDRNHPCVLAWEVSLNETPMPIILMEELHRIVHAEYPEQHVYSAGWMDEVYDIFLQARQHRILHGGYPEDNTKPYMVSEYGDWEYFSDNPGLNQHKLDGIKRIEKCSRQLRAYGEKRLLQQVYNIQEAHNDNLGIPAYGDGYWVMYDYNRGYATNIESSGIMDLFRLPKFSYYFYKSQRDPAEEIVVHIASYWTPESALDVKIFSNCDQVKLLLNDRLIGDQKPDTDENSTNLNHPPFTFKIEAFEPGTLKAIGFINGRAVAEHVVKTPGKPSGLKLWLDESGKQPEAGCNDVLFLYIAAVDQNGTIVPECSDTIEIAINGDVSVINVDPVKAEAGIATALIKIGDTSGPVALHAKTQSGNSGMLNFNVACAKPVMIPSWENVASCDSIKHLQGILP